MNTNTAGMRTLYVDFGFSLLKQYFKVCAIIFSEFLHVKNQLNMQNIIVSKFLTMKATILDTPSTPCDKVTFTFFKFQKYLF